MSYNTASIFILFIFYQILVNTKYTLVVKEDPRETEFPYILDVNRLYHFGHDATTVRPHSKISVTLFCKKVYKKIKLHLLLEIILF